MEWESGSPCCSHTYPRQGRSFPGRHRGLELELRDCGAIPGRGLLLTAERQIKGVWGRRQWWEARQPWKQGNAAESHVEGGAITVASLSPHASSSWTRQRPAHQIPEALNCGAGRPQGAPSSAWRTYLRSRAPTRGPLYVPDSPNNRERPPAREPSKGLHGRSYGERLAKQAFWSPATRGQKKTLKGP